MICSLIGCPLLCGIFLCPSHGIHWTTKLIAKTVVPITLGNFYLFGFSKYVGLKAGLINTKIADDSPISSEGSGTEDFALKTSKLK